MKINASRHRKAISPVLATVILIAITLIAAIAVAGFVFGLFGSFTSSATIRAQVVSCTATGAPPTQHLVCTLNLSNTGTSNGAVNSVTILANGQSQATTCAGGLPQTVPAGGSLNGLACTTTAGTFTEPAVGSVAGGSIYTSNGAVVPFSGTWT